MKERFSGVIGFQWDDGNRDKNRIKEIPVFKTEDGEREFWSNHSPLDYMRSDVARSGVFPDLKPSTRSISIRLPEELIEELKIIAHKRDVPYQSLAKIYLAREVMMERRAMKPSL